MAATHGTLVLARRNCIQQSGLFDERYFAYGDETEICLRAGLRGWRSALVWGAILVNPGSWTPKPLVSYLYARNMLLTIRMYKGSKWAWIRFVLKFFTGASDHNGLIAP